MSKPTWNPDWLATFGDDKQEQRNAVELLEYYKQLYKNTGWTREQKEAIILAQRAKWNEQKRAIKNKTALTQDEINDVIAAVKAQEDIEEVDAAKATLAVKREERAKAVAAEKEAEAAAAKAADLERRKQASKAGEAARMAVLEKEAAEARDLEDKIFKLQIAKEERAVKKAAEAAEAAAIAKGEVDVAKKAKREYAIKNDPYITHTRTTEREATAAAVRAAAKRDAALAAVEDAKAALNAAEARALVATLSAGADTGTVRSAVAAAKQGPSLTLKKAQAATPAAANKVIDARNTAGEKATAAAAAADSRKYVTQKVAEYRVGAAGGGQSLETGGIVKKTGLVLAHSGELVIPKQLVEKMMKTTPWLNYVKQIQKERGVSFYKALQIAKQE